MLYLCSLLGLQNLQSIQSVLLSLSLFFTVCSTMLLFSRLKRILLVSAERYEREG